jgi:hypothetical protein
MKRDWSVKPSLAPRKVEGLSSIAMARHGTGKETADRAKPCRSMEHRPDLCRKTWKGTVFTQTTMVAAFWIRASAPRMPIGRNILAG